MNIYFAPSYFECSVSNNVEQENGIVFFDLLQGCVTLNCQVQANQVTKSIDVYEASRPEYGYEQNYIQFEVNTDLIVDVTDSDLAPEAIGGKIKLTAKQVQDLNQQLEYLAEEQLQKDLA